MSSGLSGDSDEEGTMAVNDVDVALEDSCGGGMGKELEHIDLPDSFSDTEGDREYMTPASIQYHQENWQEIMAVATAPQGVHVKMGKRLKRAFDTVAALAKDIRKDKRHRTMPRLQDATANNSHLD
ncbi:hypothetical protein MPER_02428 [Moniliophthora perniciosa FA553]|nr:hypothetical protein MPER_02428 [Moniliophthora perniciosa FA553]